MWELDHKEGWEPRNWCFWTVVLEKTLESPLDCKEIKPVNLKRNQPWVFTESSDAEAEVPGFWSPDANRQLIWKVPDARTDLRQKEKRAEDPFRGWDGLTASSMQWTWTWANSRSWWRTGRPGVLQSMGSQRVRHSWAAEQQHDQYMIIVRKGDLAQAFPMAAGDCDLDRRSVLGPEFGRPSLFGRLSHLHGSGSKAGELITLQRP